MRGRAQSGHFQMRGRYSVPQSGYLLCLIVVRDERTDTFISGDQGNSIIHMKLNCDRTHIDSVDEYRFFCRRDDAGESIGCVPLFDEGY